MAEFATDYTNRQLAGTGVGRCAPVPNRRIFRSRAQIGAHLYHVTKICTYNYLINIQKMNSELSFHSWLLPD